MHRRSPLGLIILAGLIVIPTHSSDLTKAIQNIEQALRHLKNFFKYYNHYVGCYQDTAARVLKGYNLKGDPSMTREKCVGLCKNRKFKFAGLQYANECFCGNRFIASRRPEKECSMPCSGNKQQICGGGLRMSVYRIR